MTSFIGGENAEGKKLKATSGWAENGNGTDDYGFSALPGGGCNYIGFGSGGVYGYWWSASEYNSSLVYSRHMGYDGENAYWHNIDKSDFRSVRCLKD